jgi:hypothetical protein
LIQGYFSLPQGYPYQWEGYVYYPVPYIPPYPPMYSYPASCCCVYYETENVFSEISNQEIIEDEATTPEKATQMASTTDHPTTITTISTTVQLTTEQKQQSTTESTITPTESKTESSELMTETATESTTTESSTETAKQTPETTVGSTTKSSESTAQSTDITDTTTQTTVDFKTENDKNGEITTTEDVTFPDIEPS